MSQETDPLDIVIQEYRNDIAAEQLHRQKQRDRVNRLTNDMKQLVQRWRNQSKEKLAELGISVDHPEDDFKRSATGSTITASAVRRINYEANRLPRLVFELQEDGTVLVNCPGQRLAHPFEEKVIKADHMPTAEEIAALMASWVATILRA